MTTNIDDILRKYAREAEAIHATGTSGGYYTWLGLLTEVAHEIAAEVRGGEAKETSEAAKRIVGAHPTQRIQGIKELRTWLKDNGYDYSLAYAKELSDTAAQSLGLDWGLGGYRAR